MLPDVKVPPGDDGSFVLVRDGTRALARTDPHGTWLPCIAGFPIMRPIRAKGEYV